MSELNELNELNKEFLCGDPLMAQDLNDIINQANGIISYINSHKEGWSSNNGGGTTLNYPLNDINSAGLSTVPGEDYAIVSSSNGWKWKLVTTGNNQLGLNGLDGISTLLAFFGATDDTAALSAVNAVKDILSYPPSANFSTTSNITLQQGLMLYMTSAKRRGDSLYISENNRIWQIPVRIGSGSTTSTTGTDDDNYNYIYCRTKEYITPGYLDGTVNTSNYGILILTAIENDTGRVNGFKCINGNCLTVLNIDSADINDIDGAWTDHPRGVSPELSYEWLVGFKKGSNDNWEYYFGPICISHWGHNGLDGDGYEYIYYLLPENQSGPPSLTAPYDGRIGENGSITLTGVAVNSTNYQQDDFIPTNWHDEPLSVSSAYPRQYCSTRRKDGALEAGDQWQAFTEPKLWSIYASSGSSMTIDNDTIILDDDTGSDAIEYVSLTKVHLWDGLDEITFAHNTYGKITVTMTCTESFATSLKACIVTGIDNNGDVTSSVIGGDSGTGWNIEYVILSNSYNDPNVNFLGFCLRKADINNAKLNPEVGTVTYTVKAYTNANDVTPAKTASRLLSVQIVDISDGGAVYRLDVTPNTLGVSRQSESSAYTYRNGINTVTVGASMAFNLTVQPVSIQKYASNLAETTLCIKVKKTAVGNNNTISIVDVTNDVTITTNSQDSNKLDVTFNSATDVPVTVVHDYNIELWYKRDNGDVKIDNETIDFSIQGDLGPAGPSIGGNIEIFVISSINDGAIIDDLTTDLQDIINATLNPLKVYKGNTDVTLYCTFTPGTVAEGTANLPNGMSIIDLTTTNDSTYSTYKNIYCGSGGTYADRHVFVLSSVGLQLGSNWVIGSNYFYDVDIVYTDPSTSDTIFAGTKVFKLQIDSDISDDGSYYKLIITNDELSYNADGNLISNTLPTISVYNYHGSSETLVLVTPVATLPSPPVNDTIYLVLGDLYNYRNVNAASTLVTLTGYVGSDPNISQGSTIPYNIDGYMIQVRKGTKYLDSPEVISCSRIGAKGDFLSRVFTRTNLNLSSLILSETSSQVGNTSDYYNTYNYPIPPASTINNTTIIWSDGIPNGTGALWSSYCIFYGTGGKSIWSTPVIEADTESIDIEYNFSETDPGTSVPNKLTPSGISTNGWYDPSGSAPSGKTWAEAIWRAERKVRNGEYIGNWVVTRIKGERGPAGQGLGTESYVISSANDGAIIDDLTSGAGLISATINPIRVWKGNQDITSNCTFTITSSSLPSGMSVVDLSNNTSSLYYSTYSSLYSGYHLFYISGTLNNTTWTPGTYSYIVGITHTVDGSTINVGYLKFELYIDTNISIDGSYYKLYIEHDELHYNSLGTTLLNTSSEMPIIGARLIDLEGNGWNVPLNVNVVSSMPINATANELYLEVGSLSFQITDSLDYKLSSSPSYLAGGYNIKLYKGLDSGNPKYKLVDKPEVIICTKDGANGQNGQQGPGGITITINPNPTAVSFGVDSSTNLWTGSASITCTATKTISGGTTTTISTSGTIDGCRLYYNYTYINNNNQLTTSLDYYKYEGAITISAEATTTGNFANQLVTQINFYLSEDTLSTVSTLTNPLSVTASVPVLRSGKKGESGLNSTGLVGRFYYYAGDWSDSNSSNYINSNDSIIITDSLCPYVKDGNNYYMYIGTVPNTQNKSLFTAPSSDSTNWLEITYNKYLISDAIFSKYAELGALIINLDWMISLYGEMGGTTSTLYSLFDPIAFMTYLYPNDDGASIGVITRSTGTNSLMFKLNAHAKISVKWSYMSTKLVRIHDDVAYRANNSGPLESTDYDIITELAYGDHNNGNRTGSNAINTAYWDPNSDLSTGHGTPFFNNDRPISGYYCFIGGSVNYIKVKYISNTSNIFIPNYALDLRGGFVYLNNAYIRGEFSSLNGNVEMREIDNAFRGMIVRGDNNKQLIALGVDDSTGDVSEGGYISGFLTVVGSSNASHLDPGRLTLHHGDPGMTFVDLSAQDGYGKGIFYKSTNTSGVEIIGEDSIVMANKFQGIGSTSAAAAFPNNVIYNVSSFQLPSSAPTGTVYFVKGTSQDITVTSSETNIMPSGNHRDGLTNSVNCEAHSVIFFRAGNHWVEFVGA